MKKQTSTCTSQSFPFFDAEYVHERVTAIINNRSPNEPKNRTKASTTPRRKIGGKLNPNSSHVVEVIEFVTLSLWRSEFELFKEFGFGC
jgi:hypothetical protein